jgi:Ca-activated chloride channel family protein
MKRITDRSLIVIAVVAFCVQFDRVQSAVAQTAESAPTPESITIPSGQKFIMQLGTALHTRTTRKGDRVEFTTAAEIVVDNEVVIPNNSLIRGTVIKAKRAGRLFGLAEIHIRFDDIKLADGTVLPIKATITRMGFDPVDTKAGEDPKLKGEPGEGGDAKAVVTGTAQGAIIGVLTGGGKGAMYGAAAGAAITVAQMAIKRGPDLDLPRSTMFEAQFDKPVDIPAKSLQAQQIPSTPPESETQAAATTPNEEKAISQPVLNDTPGEPSAVEIAASKPAETPATASSAEPPSRANSDPQWAAGSAVATISVKVRMVQVDAVVRNRAGLLIDNLKADDFRVYEDGVLQEIQSFSRDELPLAVALVVDRSGSVANYIAELREIATRALDQLKPQDAVCLFSFAETVDRVEDLTTDRRRIADALDRVRVGGGTDITDALHDAVTYLARTAPGRRHAIILVSDNQQTTNPQASAAETIKRAVESETVVYSLKTSGEPLQLGAQLPSLILGSGPVNKITRETGGEVISVGRVSSLDSALGAIISRLRMRYSFGYYPAGTAQGGAFHSISVRLTDRHGKADSDYFIHTKRGYYATGSAAASSTAAYFGMPAMQPTP